MQIFLYIDRKKYKSSNLFLKNILITYGSYHEDYLLKNIKSDLLYSEKEDVN